MTLIVMAQTNAYAIQVSDRRLTRGDGKIFTDESNKAILYQSPTCKLIAGFAGLAEAGSWRMREWLPDALKNASSPPDYRPDGMLVRLAGMLDDLFANDTRISALDAGVKRTTLMLNGFFNTTTGSFPGYAFITNYQNFDRGSDDAKPWANFQGKLFLPNQPDKQITCVQRIGVWECFGDEQIASLRQLLREGRPPEAIVGKSVELIRKIADAPSCSGLVGKQLMSASINKDAAVDRFAYHSDIQQWTYYMPTIVIATPEQQVVTRDIRLEAMGLDAKPIVYPKQRRNEPCSCGSGRKYKHCHGS